MVYNESMKETKANVENTTPNVPEKKLGGITGKGFMPGVSGNPAGKPKGAKHLSTLLWEALQKKAKDKSGKETDSTIADLLVQRLLKDAVEKGNRIEMIFDRIDGQAKQEVDITSGGEALATPTDVDVMEIARQVSKQLKAKKTT